MGTADVIPGVSGGTMAFILGIYSELINAIKSFDLILAKSLLTIDVKTIISRPHFSFLIPLITGIFCALLFFTRIINLPHLLHLYPEIIYGLFLGLIGGSIIILIRAVGRFGLKDIVSLVLGFSVGFYVFNLVPVDTPNSAWFIFLSGSLAICAMILPGISGSFILLILNKYSYIFNAIGHLKMSILLPFALGIVAGLMVFSRVLSYLLREFYRPTVIVIIGLLLASLSVIWPFQERIYVLVRGKSKLADSVPYIPTEMSETVLYSVALIITGFLLVLAIDKIATMKSKVVS